MLENVGKLRRDEYRDQLKYLILHNKNYYPWNVPEYDKRRHISEIPEKANLLSIHESNLAMRESLMYK